MVPSTAGNVPEGEDAELTAASARERVPTVFDHNLVSNKDLYLLDKPTPY